MCRRKCQDESGGPGDALLRRVMLIVDTPEKLAEALQFIQESEILSYDIETTGLNVRKDSIIGFGISNHLDGCYFPVAEYNPKLDILTPLGLSRPLLVTALKALQGKKLLTFNGAFDIPFTTNQFSVDLLPSLYCEVMLLKHTCDEEFPFGLKEIATKLWGTEVKAEKEEMQASIKANGGTAKEYYKANSELIAAYCVQDCVLTYRIYNHYLAELKRQRLEAFYFTDEVLPLYKEVTIPMEQAGVKLDMPLLIQSLADIDQDMALIEQGIQEALVPNLGLFIAWFLNKDYPPATPSGKVPQWAKKGLTQYEAWKKDNPTGYMFNLLSKHHLKKLFFDTLHEEPLSKTPTGLPQVDEDFLDVMAKKYAWAGDLIVYNKLTKLKGTYIMRLIEEQEDGIFYPSFLQHRTVSGRYSGDMQQLPRPIDDPTVPALVRKHNNRIREFIIPRNLNILVSADYEQLEPSIFAHTSGDPALQEIFKTGKDFYSEVAIRTERLRDVSSDKSASNYLGKLDKAARQKAKAYSLGIAYGMTGYKLQYEIGVDLETADRLVADYLAAFPSLARWMDQSKDKVRYDGTIATESGRVRHMPECKALFNKFGARLGDSLQLWKDYHNNPILYAEAKAAHKTYKNYCNNAINFQVQGLAASIMNRAAINIARKLKTEQLKTIIVAQIHDELVFDMPQAESELVLPMIKHEMESAWKLSVPLRVTPQTGACFRACK